MPPDSEPQLTPLPPSFAATRRALHRVAEEIVAPARKPDNEISLRATPGGFGTPPFEHDGLERQVRVEGAELVYVAGESSRRAAIRSPAEAGELVAELLPAAGSLDSRPLGVDPRAAEVLGAWYALGSRVLAALIGEAPADDDPTPARLWPEHFDLAIESGSESAGRRANYGFSPGDEHHAEPYLYVGPWRGGIAGGLWNATSFHGAELPYAELAAADDPERAALAFCRARRDALDSMEEDG